jgi:hypothetical protein
LTFNARQRAAIKRWMGQAVPLKGVYFRSVEYRYMDPADVLSGAGTRAHGGRFAAVGIRAVLGTVLAALIGAGVGPMITPFGSLATMLALGFARREGVEVPTGRLITLGLWAVPIILVLTTFALAATFAVTW